MSNWPHLVWDRNLDLQAFNADSVRFWIRKYYADPSGSGSGSSTLVLEKNKIL
jgi:hypothetical protein